MALGFSKTFSYILLSTFFVTSALGHMQLQDPAPFRSPYGGGSGPVDYDMRSPLSPDGSNFPCKGYQNDAGPSVKTYTAGQTYSMQIEGSASHGGGSCQIALSYDNGASFQVLKSMIGGCPLKSTYSFQIPRNIKNGKRVIFAWAWLNKIGNREFYMNCAPVEITGGSGSWNGPAMFTANIGGSCSTAEGLDFVYPNPGDQVEYGGSYSSSQPPPPTQVDGCVQGSAPPPTQELPVLPPKEEPTTYPEPTSEPAPTGEPAPTEPAPTEPAPTTVAPEPTTSPVCDEEPTTIVKTVTITQTHTSVEYVTLTRSRNEDKYTRTNRPSPTEDTTKETPAPESCDASQQGEIQCYAGGMKWKFCDGTEWVDMDTCAEGQVCQDGKLVDEY